MPTDNPRVSVTLSPSLDGLVERFARHQRASKSQVLRELLEAAEPALQRAVALMDAAARAGPQVMSGMAESMLRAQEKIEDVLAGSMARIDDRVDLVSQAEAIKGRRRRGGHGAAGGAPEAVPEPVNPPSSNRGVRSTTKGAGKRGKRPAGVS
jgi:hypothetical protein